jgi:hypothetical protein
MADDRPSVPRPHTWRGNARAVSKQQTPSRRSRTIFLVLACMLALVGAIAAWFFFLRPFREPDILSIALTEYDTRYFPENAFAWKDANLLRDHFASGTTPFVAQERRQLEQEIERLKTRKGSALVVHLCGFARTVNGKLYLLPADAPPTTSDRWLDLQVVLDALLQCPTDHKLLLLDLRHPCTHTSQGYLNDDVAESLHALLQQEKNKKLLVLCACAPGQVSLVSEEMGQSVFDYYLDEGLRGYAAPYPADKARRGHITVKQLAAFVRARVDRWAWENRGVRQTPILQGEGDDFSLVVLSEGQRKAAPAPSPPGEAPALLQKGWELRDHWRDFGKFRVAPRAVRELETVLLRYDQNWRGGHPKKEFEDRLKDEIGRFEEHGGKARAAWQAALPPSPVPSLARAAPAGVKNDEMTKVLKTQLDKLKAEKPPAEADLVKELSEKFKGKVPSLELARAVLEVACDADGPALQPRVVQFLDRLLEDWEPKFRETLFLKRLAKLAASPQAELTKWQPRAVRRALQLVKQEEEVLARDPKVVPWIQQPLGEGAEKRQQWEKALFTKARIISWTEVSEFQNDAGKPFLEALDFADRVEEAQRTLDKALALLPALAPYLVHLPEPSELHAAWRTALEGVADVSDALEGGMGKKPPAPGTLKKSLEELQRLAEKLSSQLQMFHDHFQKLAATPDTLNDQTVSTLREIDELLATAAPAAKERTELRKARRRLAEKLHQRTLARDKSDNDDAKPTPNLEPPDEKAALGQQRKLAQRRAQLSLEVLKLGGLPPERLMPLHEAAREDLAQTLSKTWSREVPAQLAEFLKEDEKARRDLATLSKAVRLSHILPPFTNDPLVQSASTAALWQRREEVRRYRRWFAERYRQESAALLSQRENPARELLRDFLERKAKEYDLAPD